MSTYNINAKSYQRSQNVHSIGAQQKLQQHRHEVPLRRRTRLAIAADARPPLRLFAWQHSQPRHLILLSRA